MHIPALGLAMIGYVVAVSCVFFGNPRFAFPVLPYMAMYAGALLVMVWSALAPAKQKGPSSETTGPSEMEDGYSQT